MLVSSGVEAEGSEAARRLRRRVSARDDLELRSLSRLASLAAEETEEDLEEAVVRAQRRLEAAEEAFARFDYAGATTQLNEALELLRPSARRTTGRQRLAAVHLQLALVLHVHGEREAALEELRACVHLDPACAPDPARHPPELLALHAEARAASERPGAVLRVETDPPGARVTLDGGREASTPAVWEDVDAGRHYLTIEHDGFLAEVHPVSVAAGTPTTRRFTLTAGPAPTRAAAALRALRDRGPDAPARWRAEAADLSEADVLLVLHRTPEAQRLAAFDVRGAPLLDALESDPGDAGALTGHLDEVLPPPTVPFYGQWWFWTPVAAGVAIALAALTYLAVNVPDRRLIGGSVSRAF